MLQGLVLPLAALSSHATRRPGNDLARGKAWSAAVSLVEDLAASGESVRPGQYTAAITACRRAGEWNAALGVLEIVQRDIKLHPGDTAACQKIYTQVMSVCGKARQWEQALALIDQMRDAGIPRDTRAYNAALAACARAGQVKSMFSGLRRMASEGVQLDKASYTIALDGCARAGMTARALQLFDSMGRNGAPTADDVCYAAAIAAAARGGAWEDSLRLLRRMAKDDSVRVTLEAMSGAMSACTDAGKHTLALRLFDQLGAAQLKPDATACAIAIGAHARSGSYGNALRLFRAMRQLGVTRDAVVYHTLLHAASLGPKGSEGSARQAERIWRLMHMEGVRADEVTHSCLLQLLWRTERASDVLDEAVSQAPEGTLARCLQIDGAVQAEKWTLDLHRLSPGAAVAVLLWTLSQFAKAEVCGLADRPLPVHAVHIITGWGKPRRSSKLQSDRPRGAVRAAVLETLRICRVPESPPADFASGGTVNINPGAVSVDALALRLWVHQAVASGLIRGYFTREERVIISLTTEQAQRVEAASRFKLPA